MGWLARRKRGGRPRTLRRFNLPIELLAAALLNRAGQAEQIAKQHLAEVAQLGQLFASDRLFVVGSSVAEVLHGPRPLGNVRRQLPILGEFLDPRTEHAAQRRVDLLQRDVERLAVHDAGGVFVARDGKISLGLEVRTLHVRW
jgi:hypothetical protein